MTSHYNILRKIPNFPNYSESTFGYPERTIYCAEDSLIILGPPIHLYAFRPPKSCTVHVSGIPDWATVADVVSVFEDFGKIFTIEMSVAYPKPKGGRRTPQNPISNGSALVTYVSYDGAQKALFCHLTRRIPGMVMPLSIYKGVVNNVVLLKNLPYKTPRSDIIDRINGYPGIITISFVKDNAARMVFADLDSALLFMDVVSGGGLIIDNFTSTVEPEDKAQEEEDSLSE